MVHKPKTILEKLLLLGLVYNDNYSTLMISSAVRALNPNDYEVESIIR